MPRHVISNLLGLFGAILGGALGWLAVGYLVGQGFYGMILPGGLLGIGCGVLAQHRSTARGIACGLAGLLLSLYTEWHYFPFAKDGSLSFFVSHLQWLPPWKWAMHGVGAVLAFWCGRDHFGSMFNRPA
jgi:hypothetical protein